jgi:hypothetical protein
VPNRVIVALKVLLHIACLAPFMWLAWHLYLSVTSNPNALGPDPTATVTFFTGFATLRLLVISLAVTPVRKLIPKFGWIIRFRRMLGLYAFFYGCLHVLTYLWLYAGWSWPVIVRRKALEPAASAGVYLGHRRGRALLVDRKDRRPHAAHDYGDSGPAAGGSSCSYVVASQAFTEGLSLSTCRVG